MCERTREQRREGKKEERRRMRRNGEVEEGRLWKGVVKGNESKEGKEGGREKKEERL